MIKDSYVFTVNLCWSRIVLTEAVDARVCEWVHSPSTHCQLWRKYDIYSRNDLSTTLPRSMGDTSYNSDDLKVKVHGKNDLFIILIDYLYSQKSVIQRKKLNKLFTPPKSSKTVQIFHLKCWKHRKILILYFSILAIYVTNSSAWVHEHLKFLKKGLDSHLFRFPVILSYFWRLGAAGFHLLIIRRMLTN